MAASGAENVQMEGDAEDAATQPPYPGRQSTTESLLPSEERKRTPTAARRAAQRVRTVRLATQVHPELLVPYLYGERGGRSISSIVHSTGCTIDYCALSPDEAERSPQSLSYVMNFLVSAASSDQLEDATRQLRTLVDRLQVHLQKKARVTRSFGRQRDVQDRKEGQEGERFYNRRGVRSPAAEAAKRDEETRWTDEQAEEGWDAPVQRMYYGQRARRERPRYVELEDADEKTEFVIPGRRTTDSAADATYRQRSEPPTHFVARRRVRRYPDHPRWTPRKYPPHPRGDVGYARYAVASPDGGGEQAQRVARTRQPRHIYQGPPSHFAGYSPYGYDDGDESYAEFPAFDEAVELASENAGVNDQAEFMNVPEQHQPVRRSLKRPYSNMRNDGPPPPPIYRQRMPYIYDYVYEDEDDEWMADGDEMEVAYGYPHQYRHMDVPGVHRRRRLNSVSSQQWSSPVGRMFKRRRAPREELPLEHDMDEEPVFDQRDHEHVSSPRGVRVQTELLDQLDEVAERTTADTFPGHDGDDTEIAHVPMEDGSADVNPSDTTAGNTQHNASSHVNGSKPTVSCNEVPTESIASLAADVSDREPTVEQENSSPNRDLPSSTDKPGADTAIQPGTTLEPIAQGEVVPLNPSVPVQEASKFMSPQRSTIFSSSPTRISPHSPFDEQEGRIASPPHSVGNNDNREAVSDGDDMMDCSAESTACLEAAGTIAEENNSKAAQSSVFSVSVESDEGMSVVPKDLQPTAVTTQTGSPVVHVVTDAIRINNRVIASLEKMNQEEAGFEMVKASLAAQKDKFCRLEANCKHHDRLRSLCGVVYELQCQIGSESCRLSQARKQELFDKLDSYLEALLTESEQTIEEKLDAMQDGLKHLLTINGYHTEKPVAKSRAIPPKPTTATSTTRFAPQTRSGENSSKAAEPTHLNWEDEGWFEETVPTDSAGESEEQDDLVVHISPKKRNLKFEGDFMAVKLEHAASLSWPRELPPFVWSLLARVVSSDPQSYVMRVTHKRLMDEIAKGDPYYYLHPTVMPNDTVVSSPEDTPPSQLCEFGCRGASALKWERKLVSQISSRMKSFDNVAYSLARSSGGKEVLNRKKMNSIIRKLHLVAMQLHSLVSHLYCVKGQTTCKEVDSLPIALNNSHFERKMGVYKSRLKLVVPYKYQQQQQSSPQQLSNASEPGEELLRDTYEFFPELLLCVDIWGYNYREGESKRHNSKSVLGEKYAGLDAASERSLFPLGFFRGVESLAFDFEHDSNGLLRCICDELLNIVCLWNDFKWADNLETVPLERVVSFETDVTASIIKILELYAHHLQALWAVRLLDEPDQLRSIHFTQFNAYYSDKSQGSLNPTASSHPRGQQQSKSPTKGPSADASAVDQLVANEIVEQHLAEEYWNRKVTALSILNPDEDAMEVDDADPNSQLLNAGVICSWDHETLVSYLLRWSDVYAIRGEVKALSAVTNHMLKHEVQQYRLAIRDGNSEAGGSGVEGAVVDIASRQLLAAVSRAQMLIRDALIGAEKLALHSASSQLRDERKYPGYEETDLSANEGCASSNGIPGEELLDQANASNDPQRHEQADEAVAAETEDVVEPIVTLEEDANLATGNATEQPELRDLIQLLAVTKQDMQELCGHRPRSARMREKVQTQSLQLARQSVEIFRNITNMYGSQLRR